MGQTVPSGEDGPARPHGPASGNGRPADGASAAPAAQGGAGPGHRALDLLGPVVAAIRPLPHGLTVAHYTDFGTGLAVNLPDKHMLCLTAGSGDGLAVECDLPPWLTFETWLPDDASSGEVGLAAVAERDAAAEAFLRTMVDDVPQGDGPVARLVLQPGAVAVAGLLPSATTAPSARQRVIVLLRNPPAAFTIRQLRLNLTLASRNSAR